MKKHISQISENSISTLKTWLEATLVVFLTILSACGDDNNPSNQSSEPTVVAGNFIDFRDNKTYRTITIGSQTWMAENLNYNAANSFCYDDDPTNCSKYGRLYLWSAAMDSIGSLNGCGYNVLCSPVYPVQGVCASGWHLPTKDEFETLINVVGGKFTAGRMLKSTRGWFDNGNGTDVYFFAALPAGYRNNGGNYNFAGDSTYFWSSTEAGSKDAYYMSLNYNDDGVGLYSMYRYRALSVRCVKN
jgi:uncharacterized protein (TIGR02145 family)